MTVVPSLNEFELRQLQRSGNQRAVLNCVRQDG